MRVPYDRALVLASLVTTMRDHYLAVDCGCGVHRVIGLGVMAADRRVRGMTLAHVALRLQCEGCVPGPDRVVLTETVYGLWPPSVGGGGIGWTIPLMEREYVGARLMRMVVREDGRSVPFPDEWRRRQGHGSD